MSVPSLLLSSLFPFSPLLLCLQSCSKGFSSVPQTHLSLQLWISCESFLAPSSSFHVPATFSSLSSQPLLTLQALPVIPYPDILIHIQAPFPGFSFAGCSPSAASSFLMFSLSRSRHFCLWFFFFVSACLPLPGLLWFVPWFIPGAGSSRQFQLLPQGLSWGSHPCQCCDISTADLFLLCCWLWNRVIFQYKSLLLYSPLSRSFSFPLLSLSVGLVQGKVVVL